MSKEHIVKVERQENMPEEDLRLFTQKISNAVYDSYALFEGSEKYDVWAEVITTSQVIVKNDSKGKFFRADYSIDKNDVVSFSNIVEVVRQYVPVEEAVERSLLDVQIERSTLWGGVL